MANPLRAKKEALNFKVSSSSELAGGWVRGSLLRTGRDFADQVVGRSAGLIFRITYLQGVPQNELDQLWGRKFPVCALGEPRALAWSENCS